jgi:hypothetical protein
MASLLTVASFTSGAQTNIHGFASMIAGQASNNAELLDYNSSADFNPDSEAGVQFDFEVNEHVDTTIQLIARGEDNWTPEAEWAYLSYNMTNGYTLRTGKLRGPVFLYSDYLDVGYAQPFLRPASSMYDLLPFTAYTGADAIIPLSIYGSTLTIQPFLGGTQAELESGQSFELNNLLGSAISWEKGNLLLRGALARTDLNSDETDSTDAITAILANLLDDKQGMFAELGVRYESNNWFLVGEYGRVTVEGDYSDIDGAYISAGYHLQNITPYFVAGMTETKDNSNRADNATLSSYLNFERKEFSAGFRWDLMSNVAFKFDLTHLFDFNGTSGTVYGLGNEAKSYDNCTIISLGVETIF